MMSFRIAVLALLLAACSPPAADEVGPVHPGGKADSPIDTSKAQLVGSVVNEATGAPIPGVRIVVIGHNEQAFTDQNGVFLLSNVEPGLHTMFGFAGEPHCSLVVNPLDSELQIGVNTVQLVLAAPPSTLQRKVLVINYDPILEQEGNVRLNEFRQWNDPRNLMADTFASLAMCSGNYLHYQVAEWIDVDAIPVLEDGYRYGDQEYLDVLNGLVPGHQPGMADAQQMLQDFDVLGRVDSGDFDEVVMWGGPYMGFFESRMIGPNAYWVNGPQINTPSHRDFVLMGLNPERGVAEALHSYGHRIESNLIHELGGGLWSPHDPHSKWDRFTAYDIVQPGNAGCGTVHHPANAAQDYDYANPTAVQSRCDQYVAWPNIDDTTVAMVSSDKWGGDDFHRRYLEWWMVHIPKYEGVDGDGDFNNWWKYVADFDPEEPLQP